MSIVQEFGVELLQRQDNLLRGEARSDSVRLALLASGRGSVSDLFPEYFPTSAADTEESIDQALADPEAALDLTGVDFAMPGSEEMALLAQLSQGSVSVSGEDLGGEWV